MKIIKEDRLNEYWGRSPVQGLFCPKCGATDPDIETCIPPDYEDMKCNVCGYVGEPRVFWIDGHFTTDDAQERIRRENEVNTPKPVQKKKVDYSNVRKDGIIRLLRNLQYRDEVDSEQVDGWNLYAWNVGPSRHFSDGKYIIQIDNDDIDKHLYAGDIESEREFDYKVDELIKKIQSLKESKKMNEDKDTDSPWSYYLIPKKKGKHTADSIPDACQYADKYGRDRIEEYDRETDKLVCVYVRGEDGEFYKQDEQKSAPQEQPQGRYSKENCLKALSKMTEEEKWSYIDEEQGMDEQVYDKDGIINRYGADEEEDAWVFNGIESGAKYFVPDYEVCGSFEDIVGDDEMVYDALSDESRKDIVDKYLNESLTEALSPEEAGASGLFNDLIQREYEQLNQYDSVQITLEDQGDDRFSEILEYIKDDLNIHIGMLQSCLDDITGSGEQVDQGESQADQVLGEGLQGAEKMTLEESLFNEEQQVFYDYPDELVWTFFDWCAELDPYDFPYRSPEECGGDDIDGWERDCRQISPDDIMEQVSEEMEYVADDPVNQELIHLGQKVIEMAKEFRDKYIED